MEEKKSMFPKSDKIMYNGNTEQWKHVPILPGEGKHT